MVSLPLGEVIGQFPPPAFANNAAAVAALGAGRLYYTDTGGEYVAKVSH